LVTLVSLVVSTSVLGPAAGTGPPLTTARQTRTAKAVLVGRLVAWTGHVESTAESGTGAIAGRPVLHDMLPDPGVRLQTQCMWNVLDTAFVGGCIQAIFMLARAKTNGAFVRLESNQDAIDAKSHMDN
jgi:hypothetical protein